MTHRFTMFNSGRLNSRIPLITAALLLAFLLFPQGSQQALAQGSMTLSTNLHGTNGQAGISFEVTALKSVRLYRLWTTPYSGSNTCTIYGNPAGLKDASGNPRTTGWTQLGQATVTGQGYGTYVEIPVDLDLLLGPNDKYGFVIMCSGNVNYNTGQSPYIFSDSYLSIDTQCWGMTGPTSFGFYPRQFNGKITYDEGITGPNDAGIASIDSPVNFCAGNKDVKVSLHNFGTNQLTSATINWELNGVAQSPYNWTGLLDTTNATTRETQITLANMNFQSGVPYTITAWTTMPNGVQDTINNNDSSSVVTQAAIAGTFTIGGASPDYADFASAVADLNQFGLCGPVVFNVRPGTYNEQIELDAINGASSVNTITFQSETGNKADVDLTFSATSSSSNWVVNIGLAEWVTFKDMTITATGSSYARVVYFSGGGTDNTFDNCELVGRNSNSTSTYLAVVYSESGTMNHRTTFKDCGIREGSYGMYLYGGGTTSTEDNNVFLRNEFTGQYYSPIRTYYLGSMSFLENKIYLTDPAYSYRYPASFYYGQDNSIERNVFFSDGGSYGYGVYLYYQNYYQSGSTRFVNNMVSILNTATRTYYGVYQYRSYNTLVAHNTVTINTNYSSSYAYYSYYPQGCEFYNNMFYHTGAGYAWYVNGNGYINNSDYNLLYTNGNNLAYWAGTRSTLSALQSYSGMDANTISKSVTFADPATGDLHLASPSDDDTDLFGTLLASVTQDIDGESRVNPYRGADEACYVAPGSLNYSFVDGQGLPAAYAEAPGSVGVEYSVTFPEFASTVTFTVQFFDVTTNTLAWQTSFQAAKAYNMPLSGVQYINLPQSLQAGTYKIEVIFNTKNSCDVYRDYMPYPVALLVVGEGQKPCVVWPGDVNNDGIVNYTDRRELNLYIYNANLRSTWLSGPARYQADAETNPFTYIEWKPQAAAPWYTPEGCYMDTDGNGVVNNMDYIAMKLNWAQTTPYYGGTPKSGTPAAASFAMDQNYPNPFNPTTMIKFSVPEQSHVRLVVTDALGRQVAELVNGNVDQGLHEVQFDASQLSSGTYIATVSMTGAESGMSFTKNIKMVLSK
ncbi:T9SS type A sorting domain-containing protein [bacterium]|nr:T9SS type A sorting domain-containing protein [bacterium]